MTPRVRAQRSDGLRTRAAILEAATAMAGVSGLEGLSIGGLAGEVGMSKSGLYAHFDSKEALQIATVDTARDEFIETVVAPALRPGDPLGQLRALAGGFLRYVEALVFPGGCFFVTAAAEVGPRSGPLRDRVAEIRREWVDLLERTAIQARDHGQLDGDTDPHQLAFRISALLVGTNVAYVLDRDARIVEDAFDALDALLPG